MLAIPHCSLGNEKLLGNLTRDTEIGGPGLGGADVGTDLSPPIPPGGPLPPLLFLARRPLPRPLLHTWARTVAHIHTCTRTHVRMRAYGHMHT